MSARAIGAVWVLLLVMLGVEFWLRGAWAPPIGIVMAVIVALTFMRLARMRGLPAVFALAGLFWLVVLIGMGSLDSLTRHDVGISQGFRSYPQP